MTLKEAILQSLEDIKGLTNHNDVYDHIIRKNYYEFANAETPKRTVSATLGNFIRIGDTRVRRVKRKNHGYSYYLTKHEQTIGIDVLTGTSNDNSDTPQNKKTKYEERDLHKLLSSYLKVHNIYTKTIFHEKSSSSADRHQKWIHPDIVGIAFLKLQTKVGYSLLKTVNKNDTFKLNSYEIKKEINSDYDLKEAFFQAVSNSSWANHGYLVAFYINESLHEEMKRLNQSFGIGVIELKANPFESRVLFPSIYKELDFKTIDKLCKINNDFEKFIDHIEKIITASDKYVSGAEKELESFCDDYLVGEAEVEQYCKEKGIPWEEGD